MTKTSAERMREWRQKHPEHSEYMRQWRKDNAEHIKEWRKKRYAANRESELADSRSWNEANKFQAILINKAAKANKRYPGKITPDDLRLVIERTGWNCHWCKKQIVELRDFTLEHLRPINDPQYLTIACRSCNSRRITVPPKRSREEQDALNAARKKRYDKQYKVDHKEQENAGQRARYHSNIEERRAYFREWQRRKRAADKLK